MEEEIMEDENILFSNVSALGEKESKALTKITAFWPMILGCVLLPLLFFAVGGVWCIFDLTFGIVFIIGGAVVAIIYPILFRNSIQKLNRSIIEGGKILNHFDFGEDVVKVSSERKVNEQTEEYAVIGTSVQGYGQFYKVIFTSDYIFLFINKQQSYVIDVNGMVKGDASNLKSLLKEKITKCFDKTKKDKEPKV